ncbi:MAG TPA: DUF5671 domain-containing protein [Candidatus Magasanikbacteria bacterium]|nr:DUF5671 domain-containing protein [Candidatus Magasanikbacteria bacterium]
MAEHKSTARDFFLHLLSIVTLYMSATAFITLLFQYVNRFFPDALLPEYYYYDMSNGPLRFAIATLVVVFPVYIWSAWYLQKGYTKHPESKTIGVRKWLIYLTLFVAIFMIIGSLISVLNSFLSGELTVRFFLKALSVLLVAAMIFSYYLYDIRDALTKGKRNVFRYGAIGLVVVFVVGAFFLIGSPARQRILRFDGMRSQHLQSLKYSIDSYYSQSGHLPTSLEELNQAPYYVGATVADPETGVGYEYNATSNTNYELCATFSAVSPENTTNVPSTKPYGSDAFAYEHGVGRQCFQLAAPQKITPVVPVETTTVR